MSDDDATCSLAAEECIPCKGGVPPLSGDALRAYMARLGNGWELCDEKMLRRVFAFNNFKEALDFTCAVGELAEAANHHPDIELSWGRVVVKLLTHKIKGLSQADFVLAARINGIAA